MRIRERGVGNMAFIAVLILFVVAAVLAFMWKDEGDSLRQKNAELRQDTGKLAEKLAKAGQAYDVLPAILGVPDLVQAVARNGDTYKKPADIREACIAWLLKTRDALQTASTAIYVGRVWTASGDTLRKDGVADMKSLQFYKNTMAGETASFSALIAPIAGAFTTAGKFITENNKESENQYVLAKAAAAETVSQAAKATQEHAAQVATIKAAQETADAQRTEFENGMTRLTADVDGLRGKEETLKATNIKVKRDMSREIRALKTGIINLKEKKILAREEDPKDGEIVGSNPRNRVCWINLGRVHKVRTGMIFTAWRAGKGNQRQDLAEIRVLKVDRRRSECSIVKIFNSSVPVGRGHNISNAFYSPTETLIVYISGSLRRYDTSTAARRLAASGVKISAVLDDRVQVIVLGEPDVSAASGGDEVDTDDPEAVKALKAKEDALRETRLNEVIEKARAIGAVVVTEGVLSTFIDW